MTPSLSCVHKHLLSSDWERRPCPLKYFDTVSVCFRVPVLQWSLQFLVRVFTFLSLILWLALVKSNILAAPKVQQLYWVLADNETLLKMFPKSPSKWCTSSQTGSLHIFASRFRRDCSVSIRDIFWGNRPRHETKPTQEMLGDYVWSGVSEVDSHGFGECYVCCNEIETQWSIYLNQIPHATERVTKLIFQ